MSLSHIKSDPIEKAGTIIQRFARSLVLKSFEKLERGYLRFQDCLGTHEFGSVSPEEFSAQILVHDLSFYPRIAFGSCVGAADSYLDRQWQTDSLVDVFRIILRNPQLKNAMGKGLALAIGAGRRIAHWTKKNSKSGSRRNIAAHYDLSNELFELFLDPTLSYSSLIYPSPAASMHEAAIHKFDLICDRLQLKPSDHLLEIGTGWGGLAIHAAQKTGCQVTTTTISAQQYKLAKERVLQAGLEDQVTVLLSDYRDLNGKYDKLVSVEMIEAVGSQYYNQYFEKCDSLLKEDGRMMLQAITIADREYDQARKEVDFIKKYIFPGSCIPSVSAISQAIARKTSLDLIDLQDYGIHYARTLREWRESFRTKSKELEALGFDLEFQRLWEYYLIYCESGFLEQQIRCLHLVWAKPLHRGLSNGEYTANLIAKTRPNNQLAENKGKE